MLRLHDDRAAEPLTLAGPGTLRIRVHDPVGLAGLRPLLLADLVRRSAERRRIRALVFCDDPGEELRTAALTVNIPPPAPWDGAAGPRIDLHVTGPGADCDGEGRWIRCGELRAAIASPAELTAAGLDPLAVRLALLAHGHRPPVDLTDEALRDAAAELARWRRRVAEWAESPSHPIDQGHAERIQRALDDDLDTAAALRLLRELEHDESVPPGSRFETFIHFDRVLGLDLPAEIGKI
ncbi:MAG: hypothetical protein QM207_05295 [Thermobispora sp.]|nr:hypothetical protein [Thermobispora sp.]